MMEAFVKPPEPLEATKGNPAHTWVKWRQRFQIYLQATSMATKPSTQKVGLLLNHIGENGIEIFTNFAFDEGEDRTNFDTVVGKFDAYFTKRDPPLMPREHFWCLLRHEPGQSLEAWINTFKERAAECKFPEAYREQAIRDKVTFACTDDGAKLKLYDVMAELTCPKSCSNTVTQRGDISKAMRN